jgi:hypothetical protein
VRRPHGAPPPVALSLRKARPLAAPVRLLPLLACALTLAGEARAQEGPAPGSPAEPPPPSTKDGGGAAPEPAADGAKEAEAPKTQDGWLDASHSFVEQRIFAPVLRLDRFFSDERDIEYERAQSFLRWRSEIRFEEERGSRPVLTTGVRANLRLPGLNQRLRRLRIVVAGETRDAISALLPPESGDVATEEEIGSGDAGLRFDLWDSLVSHVDLGGGFLVRLPPGVFTRLRFRWTVPIRKLVLARTAVSGFFRSDTEFGTSVSAELERPLSPVLVARLGGNATLTEVSPGVEWVSELGLLASLDRRSGAQLGVAVLGVTDKHVAVVDPVSGLATTREAPGIDRYRVFARLRREVYRRWIFLEIEPGVAWPWAPDRGRYPEALLALRVEMQFQGKEAPPPEQKPARARGPEPEDPPDP